MEHNVDEKRKNVLKGLLTSGKTPEVNVRQELVILRMRGDNLWTGIPDAKSHKEALAKELHGLTILEQRLLEKLSDSALSSIQSPEFKQRVDTIIENAKDTADAAATKVAATKGAAKKGAATKGAAKKGAAKKGATVAAEDSDQTALNAALNIALTDQRRAKIRMGFPIDITVSNDFMREYDETNHRIALFMIQHTDSVPGAPDAPVIYHLYYVVKYANTNTYIYCRLNMFEFDPLEMNQCLNIIAQGEELPECTTSQMKNYCKSDEYLIADHHTVLAMAKLESIHRSMKTPVKFHPNDMIPQLCEVTEQVALVDVNLNEHVKMNSPTDWFKLITNVAGFTNVAEFDKLLVSIKNLLSKRPIYALDMDRYAVNFTAALKDMAEPYRLENLHKILRDKIRGARPK